MFDSSSGDSAASNEGASRPWSGIVDRVRSMEYGQTIPTAALYLAAGMSEVPSRSPGENDKRYAKRCDKHRLLFASMLDKARRELLKNHKRDMRSSKPGEYELVRPSEQADLAQRDALREARRALTSGALRAQHVNTQMLSDAERKRASDIEAHLDALRAPLRAMKVKK